jgi:hypothetical protein
VGAVPVSIRTGDRSVAAGNHISVMLAELPTHLRDPRERLEFTRESMQEAKRSFDAVPASLLQDFSALVPTALSGLAARALFKLATVPGVPFNLFVSNVPGPQLPLYIAGARVTGVHPVSAVTDLTGGLNITLFSYDGALDFGLIACREMVPDVWNLIGYLRDAMAEMVALVQTPTHQAESAAGPAAGAPRRPARKRAAKSRESRSTSKTAAGTATAGRTTAGKTTAGKTAAGKTAAGKTAAGRARSAKSATAKTTSAKRKTRTSAPRATSRPTESSDATKKGSPSEA